jgi:hypothetical protein
LLSGSEGSEDEEIGLPYEEGSEKGALSEEDMPEE